MMGEILIQCINNEKLNKNILLNKIYRGVELGLYNDRYSVSEIGVEKNHLGIFPKKNFKVIKAKTLLDVMKETDKNQIFLVVGIKDKILIRKRKKSLQSKNLSLNTTWKEISMSSKWFKYVYQVYNTPVTFSEAVKSHKKFKLSSWSYFFDVKDVLGRLVSCEDKIVDELINSKSWIIEY